MYGWICLEDDIIYNLQCRALTTKCYQILSILKLTNLCEQNDLLEQKFNKCSDWIDNKMVFSSCIQSKFINTHNLLL